MGIGTGMEMWKGWRQRQSRDGNRDGDRAGAGTMLTLALDVLMFSMFSMLLTQLLGTLLQARRM